MNTLQLELFISISQTRNFTKTAQEFYMAQPTVSNHIKDLERSVGVKLLIRNNREVTLSPEGEIFVEYAEKMLMMQMDAESRMRNISRGRAGHISVATLSSTAQTFSQCLTEYSKLQPDVQVDIYFLRGIEMIKALNRRDHDLYFCNRYMLPTNSDVRFFATGVEQLYLYINKSIAGEIDVDDWSTLQKFRFLAMKETDFSLAGQIKRVYENRGVTPEAFDYFNQADMVLLAVNSGVGIAVLPKVHHYYNFPDIMPIPISGEDAEYKSVVVWHEEKLNANPSIRDFLTAKPFQDLR